MKGYERGETLSLLFMGYIYKITNDVNDKVYIGQTHGLQKYLCDKLWQKSNTTKPIKLKDIDIDRESIGLEILEYC